MNYFGAYHWDVRPQALGICDAPHISKGRMMFSGFETASNASGMAMVHGNMRNRAELARSLNCTPYASQAEILLRAYEAWGEDFILHIEGPCMCAVADIDKGSMMLARDRMGETAVFYACRGQGMVFADHPDMILRSACIEPVVDGDGLCEIFGLGPARTPGKTPLKGMKTLEPGCMIVCSEAGVCLRRYHALAAHVHTENEKTTVEHVRQLLEQSINSIVHLHPGCMLSGGLDSTALSALLSTRIGRLETFSVDYRDNDQDFVPNAFRPEMDAPYIQMASKLLGSRHRSVILEQDALAEALNAAVRARGFPGMADIDSSLLLFARTISRHAPSVVSGECGDEVFGGYPWFAEGWKHARDRFPWSGSMELREAILRPEVREKIGLKRYVRDALQNSLESYDVVAIEDENERRLFQLQRLCFDYFMANLQERAVKMCECCGLQVLTPLCDDRLVEYVYNVPWKLKRMGGMEKGLYRAAVQDLLPDKLRMRKKSPYPKTCSAAYTSLIKGKMRALCADPQAPVWKIVDICAMEKLAASKLDPADTPWFGQLMAGPQMLAYILQVNAWLAERNIAVEL